MLKIGISILLVLSIVGCTNNSSCSCPKFPYTSQSIIDKINGTKDKELIEWKEELYKLNLKLKERNGNL